MRADRRFRAATGAVVLTAMVLSSGAIAHPVDLARPMPIFRAEKFFAGRTIGQGSLRILMGRHNPTLVHGSGRVDANGTLTLDQDVQRQGKPIKHRQWRIWNVGADSYAGTLTDAAGPITGHVSGNLLTLRFPMKGGLRAEQRLYLSPDGQVAENFMKIRKAGVVVATLTETIRRISPNR